MITGVVTPDLEAIIRLHVEDVNGQTQAIELKIDTAFTDFISLPVAMIAALGLSLDTTYEYVRIADGSVARARSCRRRDLGWQAANGGFSCSRTGTDYRHGNARGA